MITYFRLIHCHWVSVTTSLARWASLPHVVSLAGCVGVAAWLALPLSASTPPVQPPHYAATPPYSGWAPPLSWGTGYVPPDTIGELAPGGMLWPPVADWDGPGVDVTQTPMVVDVSEPRAPVAPVPEPSGAITLGLGVALILVAQAVAIWRKR